jgi:FkbM family methyltransferase
VKALVKRALGMVGFELTRKRRNRFEWLRTMGIKTVLDIGANTGQFARFARQLLPASQIYSFEPLSECYEHLQQAMKGVDRFQAIRCALGEADGVVDMHRSQFSPSSSLLPMGHLHARLFPFSAKTWVERVPVRALDSVANELSLLDPTLIKIDVQGYEDRVIRGGARTVSRARVLVVEASFQALYESQVLFDSVYEMLKELGFRYAGNLEQLHSPLDGSAIQCDAVFVPAQ